MNYKLILLLAILFMPGMKNASCLSTDLSLGMNIDITPYGIEIIQPGAAVHLWFDGINPFYPGLSSEFYYRQDRFDIAFNITGRYDLDIGSVLAGAGVVYEQTDAAYFYPEAELGARFVFNNLFTFSPLVSVRIKPSDTDTDLRFLAGVNF